MRLCLGFLQVLVGLGALSGGALLVWDPSGDALGLPLGLLRSSVFSNYLIPGVFLFFVHGVGSVWAAFLCLTKHPFTGWAAITFGVLLVGWIVTQVAVIGCVFLLQPIFLLVGLVEIGLGIFLVRTTPD